MADENKPPGIFVPPGLSPGGPMGLPTPGAPTPAPVPAPAPVPQGQPPAAVPPPITQPPAALPPQNLPAQISAPASAPETATGTPTKGRVVVFSGPKEGVGKSTIALNLALAWAGTQSRNVIIVHLDPLCRTELSFMLGLQPPTLASLAQFVGKDVTVLSKLLKGRVPISQWGVGILPLGNKRTEAIEVSPHVAVPILESLSGAYDIFIDVDPFFPMQIFAFDLADLVFWTCLPQRAHFEATYKMFEELKEMHFPLERFQIVINQGNLPGALAPKEVEKFFEAMNKRVLSYMPWEDLLPEFANTARILVVEQPHSDWVKALRPLLGAVMELKPTVKDWTSAVSARDIQSQAGSGWVGGGGGAGGMDSRSNGGGGSGGSGSGSDITVSAPGALRKDVPEFWDELKGKMHKNVVVSMETERVRITDDAKNDPVVRGKVDQIINSLLQKESNLPLSRDQRTKFVEELIDEILGLGPLEVLMRDESVNEIMVNAPDKVFIEEHGQLVLTPLRFRDEEQVIQVIKRIIAPLGRRIDESVPLVDARLKDGSRVNAIIPPLAVSGASITIRRFAKTPFTPQKLLGFGAFTEELLEFMGNCVEVRKSVIISGGTGTGKTTFLNMLSTYIPEGERIITVEDTAELQLKQVHWVRLESRPANVEGKGAISIRDLIKNCLRMRPDRIVVGECRGGEALDMLQAMNTGHEGSLATIHANNPRDALTRLEAMCMMASAELPVWAVREMIASAVHLVVQLTRFSDGKRRVTYVTEITGRDGNTLLTQDLFRFCQTGVDEDGKSQGFFTACGKPPKFYPEFKLAGKEVPLELFNKKEGADHYLRGGK